MPQPYAFRRFQTVQSRHRDIYQRHIGIQLFNQFDGVMAVVCFADDLNAFRFFQQRSNPLPYHVVVVCQDYADHMPSPRATRETSGVLRPGSDTISTCPPSRSMRSRIPINPIPAVGPDVEMVDGISKPWPSSVTDKRTSAASAALDTRTSRASACLATVV